jgi:hypothetical protein
MKKAAFLFFRVEVGNAACAVQYKIFGLFCYAVWSYP